MRRLGLLVAVLTSIAAMAAAPGYAAAPAQGSVAPAASVAPRASLPVVDPLTPRLYLPFSQKLAPPGFRLNAIQARQVAARTPEVRRARARYPAMTSVALLSPLQTRQGVFWHWDIYYVAEGKDVLEVEVHPSGAILQVTEPPDIGWPLLLGFPGVLGGKLNAPWIWLPLCLIFFFSFFDPRRPFRLLHLDLLMLLGFGASQFFFTAGKPDLSVPLVYPFLIYAVVRAASAGFRPARRSGPLMPLMTTRVLIFGVALFFALRIAFGITSSDTFDISTAGVIGADRIEHGLPLYVDNDAHGDTYGPVNYLMYVPWELVFPFKPPAGSAARAATLSFDALTILGLFLLGRAFGAGGRASVWGRRSRGPGPSSRTPRS
jgi:hypothetical protein